MNLYCSRFVINKLVRKDLIETLPLPRRMIDYLSTPHYHSELISDEEQRPDVSYDSTDEGSTDLELQSVFGVNVRNNQYNHHGVEHNYVLIRTPAITNRNMSTQQFS